MTILHISCACRRISGSTKVPVSKLPLPFELCHCNICRHQTGLLCASYLTLPEDSTDIDFEGPLSHYKSSDTVIRTFCSHCGANVYLQDSSEATLHICTGVLDKTDGVIRLRNQIFVPDSRDGGLSLWIPDIPAWEGFSQPPHPQSKQWVVGEEKRPNIDRGTRSELHAYCQCRGVQFKVTPPNRHSVNLSAPNPDLYRNNVVSNTSANERDPKWWLCAEGQKYLAGTCACRSCRLASGFDIQVWAFIPKANILQLNGDFLEFGMGTLSQYESSKGTYRHFCGRCGATVFWRSDNRPELIDVSVGLLNAEEGARAETWLSWWTDRVSFEEESQNKGLITMLGAGLKQWGTAQHSSPT